MAQGQNQNNVNVNINAVPKGFEQARQQYERMSQQMLDGAKNFSKSHQEQLRFIREESAERKKEYDEWLREYNDKSAKLELLSKRKSSAESAYTAGRITKETYDSRMKAFKADERETLKDTGYKGRNAAGRYISQEGQQLAIGGETVPKLEQLIEVARTGFRGIVSQDQTTAREMIRAIQKDPNATPEQRLSAQMAEQHLNDQKKKEKDSTGFTVAKAIASLAWDKSLSLMAQAPSAKNELDLVKPVMSMLGMLTGGLMGAAADLADIKILGTGAGQSNFTGLGTALGEKVGEITGDALNRSFQDREQLGTKNLALQGLTGRNFGIDLMGTELQGTGKSSLSRNLTGYGMNYMQTADLQLEIAKATGSGNNLTDKAENTAALEKAYGLDQGTLMGLMDLQRSSQMQNRDIVRLTSGVLKSGSGGIFKDDRTFLGEFLQKNFTGLQRELLKGQSYVASGTTMDILKRFDSMGGEFGARDPRSMGLISQIQNSLANPGSDNMKALSFQALRQANPSMGIADLMLEREKGLASPTYLKSMLGYVNAMGGDDQMKRLNIAGMFGVNQSAAKRIFEHQAALTSGKISISELTGDSEASIRAQGKRNTSPLQTQQADLENTFVENVLTAMNKVTGMMEHVFGALTVKLIQMIDDKITGRNRVVTPNRDNATFDPTKGRYIPKISGTKYVMSSNEKM